MTPLDKTEAPSAPSKTYDGEYTPPKERKLTRKQCDEVFRKGATKFYSLNREQVKQFIVEAKARYEKAPEAMASSFELYSIKKAEQRLMAMSRAN